MMAWRRRTIWIFIPLALIAALAIALALWTRDHGAVALLDGTDRLLGAARGTRLALADGRYGPDPAQRIEVIVPAGQPPRQPRPVLVFFHGGSWQAGTPGDYRFVGRRFARAGYVVVLAGYRLGPAGAWPHMLDDSAAALAWAWRHAADYAGDPARLFAIGHSAGAYNAVMLGLERQWLGRQGLPEGTLKGVIGLSGPYDFYPFTTPATRAAFAGAPDPRATQPVAFARGDAPPMLLLTGDADTTVRPRNTLALAAALTAAGRPTVPVILPGVDHAGTVMKLARPFSRDTRVIDPVLAFLAANGAPSPPVQRYGR